MAITGFDQTAGFDSDRPATTIALRGDGDLATLPALEELLDRVIADHRGAVVVDLTEADFLDTASVRALGQAAVDLGDRDRLLTLRSPSRQARMAIAAFGFSHLVDAGERADR